MTAPDAIHELVAKFNQHQKEYQSHKNETELRREFLDPFFEALGWDVFNKKSYSERFKEVLHEASVEVEGKAKDWYCCQRYGLGVDYLICIYKR